VTSFELELAARQLANAIERRILANVQRMHARGVPPEQIAAALELEHETLTHWVDHELKGQVIEALQALEAQ
jgi:hypothetical protein